MIWNDGWVVGNKLSLGWAWNGGSIEWFMVDKEISQSDKLSTLYQDGNQLCYNKSV